MVSFHSTLALMKVELTLKLCSSNQPFNHVIRLSSSYIPLYLLIGLIYVLDVLWQQTQIHIVIFDRTFR